MSVQTTPLKRTTVNRTQLRRDQRATLQMASGSHVVVISSSHEQDEKILIDRRYFNEILGQLRSMTETLDIMNDQKLFKRILEADEGLEGNTRRGTLHPFEDAFGTEKEKL